jgi:hypothetical protein
MKSEKHHNNYKQSSEISIFHLFQGSLKSYFVCITGIIIHWYLCYTVQPQPFLWEDRPKYRIKSAPTANFWDLHYKYCHQLLSTKPLHAIISEQLYSERETVICHQVNLVSAPSPMQKHLTRGSNIWESMSGYILGLLTLQLLFNYY